MPDIEYQPPRLPPHCYSNSAEEESIRNIFSGFNSVSSSSTRDLSSTVQHSDCLNAIPTAAAGSRLLAELDLIPSQGQAKSHTDSEAIMKSKTLEIHGPDSDAASTLTNIPHAPIEAPTTSHVAQESVAMWHGGRTEIETNAENSEQAISRESPVETIELGGTSRNLTPQRGNTYRMREPQIMSEHDI